ncbi:MAG: hypothetical protein OXK76_01335 [Gammaproteobacteria bacterium]|nr:hypothetical protein [Gammaproteobacteria bacterium]
MTVKSSIHPTDDQHAFAKALRQLLSRRRKGKFVSGERMDERLAAMVSKRRAN